MGDVDCIEVGQFIENLMYELSCIPLSKTTVPQIQNILIASISNKLQLFGRYPQILQQPQYKRNGRNLPLKPFDLFDPIQLLMHIIKLPNHPPPHQSLMLQRARLFRLQAPELPPTRPRRNRLLQRRRIINQFDICLNALLFIA